MTEGTDPNTFVWMGEWTPLREWMDKMGYQVEFLGHPLLFVQECKAEDETELMVPILHLYNRILGALTHVYPGEVIRWLPQTKAFTVEDGCE